MARVQNTTLPHFPILRLPTLAMKKVMENFNVIELLEFSTLSKRAALLIPFSLHLIEPKIDVEISDTTTIKVYKTSDDLVHDFEWSIGKLTVPRVAKLHCFANIAGTKRIEEKTSNQPNLRYLTNCEHRSEPALHSVLIHMRSVFPRLHVQTLQYRKTDLKLELALSSVKNVDNLHIFAESIDENSKFLIEHITVRKRFSCNADHNPSKCEITDKLHCSESINSRMTLWMDPSRLTSLNCKNIKFLRTKITATEFESFLLAWQSSTDDRYSLIQHIDIGFRLGSPKLNVQRLGAKAWDGARRPRYCTFDDGFSLDCRNAFDIEKADGTIASVMIKRNNGVEVVVWPK